MSNAILIIDDEATLAKNVKTYLARHGYEAQAAASGEEGLAQLDHFKPDVVLLDFQMEGMNGLDVLRRIRAEAPHIKVIMLTGHGGVEVAVEAMKAGAYDYLTKPVVLGELKRLLDKAVGQDRLESALSYYQGRQAEQSGLNKLLGESPPMLALKHKIRQFIEAERRLIDGEPPAVLITGETGTGKELVARAFHFEGPRQRQPFVEINCAAIPAQLLETELFGFERGAFTDAKERKLGLVEMADGGTLFLDEIGEMQLSLQAKLLKLLEDKTVRRLGSLRDQKVNLRIIAATNQSLEERVQQGQFRSDLFFRLRIIHIALPSLRERAEDIILLARAFLDSHGKRYGKPALRFTAAAEQALCHYTWPGNVRELRNGIEHAVLLAEDTHIEPQHLAVCPALTPAPPSAAPSTLAAGQNFPQEGIDLERLEQELIVQALQHTGWNVSRAAKLLGLSRDTLRYRMEKYRLYAPT
ncbi:MAG: sigma-54-dependent Fis family transcriptional regulator [Candidatus Competibacteraceae bacterium]|nr:sigma-54-dependent Fis family transcriptional regulator [Candidatus Competibacteraceae bacterium]MBK7983483.1 sigma-54-dependent Fis family transcriptional regulator [Candidatus Competibacteraceae bacterium]MBK8897976.1 sigma-54-dependent Fis family transcriptional regulator [Candidatus Competibacteraceae bacterium]MBK8961780.1 sigma-54-dependent Fis family transcriptional regulator [Candidatus Competibacteraceae bacterium]MBK9950996.1 sigma-54-dependent Fis family transcriptional regulator 